MEITWKEIVGAILVILVIVVALIYSTSASGNLSQDSLKFIDKFMNFLGFGKEFDYTQANQDAQNSFTVLNENIIKCKDSSIKNCGCELDLSGFSENHVIRINKDKVSLFDSREYEKTTSTVNLNEFSISNINCIWKNKNENIVKDFQIRFKKENEIIVPKLYYEVNWGSDYEKNLVSVKLYKTSNGKTCWLDANSDGFGTIASCI